jgi:hypothetical protein
MGWGVFRRYGTGTDLFITKVLNIKTISEQIIPRKCEITVP